MTPDEENLQPHDRLRQKALNLINAVWQQGLQDEDDIGKYVDEVLKICGDEAVSILPEHAEEIRKLFDSEK